MSRIEKTTFLGASGAPLAGIINWPQREPAAFAVFAHCFTCSKDVKAAYRVSRTLAEEGIAVLRFDFSGLGESGGDFVGSSFSTNIADLVAAAAHLRENHRSPSLLVGHSLGGTAALATAARIPEVRAVVSIAAPLDPSHLRRHLLPVEGRGDHSEEVTLEVAGRRFRLGRQFLDDLQQHDMKALVGSLGRALLVAHSPADRVVSLEQASSIYQAANHPKSFLSLDRADHLLSKREDAAWAGQCIAAWAARYLMDEPRSIAVI